LGTDLAGDTLEDDANEATEDLVCSDGSRCVQRSTALDGATVAAAVDNGRGDCGGSEGGGGEEGYFGEHF
jgi:hypothetical protein